MKCIVCGSKEHKKVRLISEYSKYNKKKYPLYKCLKCGLIRPVPLPYTEETKEDVYDETDNIHFFDSKTGKIQEESIEFKYYFKHFKPYLKIIDKYEIKDPVMDVGCGSGHLMQLLEEKGMKVEGMEINPVLVNALKDKYKIHLALIGDKRLKNNAYNLVTFNQVLEHVEDPEDFLRGVNKITKKEGYIIFASPYLYGFIPNIIRSFWYGMSKGQHLNFFSKKSLKILLEKTGFELVEFKPLCVDYAHPKFPRVVNFFGDLVSSTIVKLGGGDNIFVVAKKKKESKKS